MMLDEYLVGIRLTREQLGTNSMDPNQMDTHVLDRERKLIAGESKINKSLVRYLEAKAISDEQVASELEGIRGAIEDSLGVPLSDEEYEEIKSKGFDKFKDLKETLIELSVKGTTCFFREQGKPAIGNHMIIGFLKAAGEALSRTVAKGEKKKEKMIDSAAYTAKVINTHCNVLPRYIIASKDVERYEEGAPKFLQRSLRGQTKQGPRVSLAKSEMLPEGTEFKFTIKVLKNSPMTEEVLRELLSYGELRGLGQWRNVGYGTFEVVEFQKL